MLHESAKSEEEEEERRRMDNDSVKLYKSKDTCKALVFKGVKAIEVICTSHLHLFIHSAHRIISLCSIKTYQFQLFKNLMKLC